MWADQCLNRLLADYQFTTVLDVGSGDGEHAAAFRAAGKQVTTTDLKTDGDYLQQEWNQQFDCVWCSHVLEHAPNAGMFLRALAIDCKEGGVLAITVPPLKHEIVGGHVSLWNAGLLTYRLCLAGLDCSEISLKKYDYNISALLTKRTITLPKLVWDSGDIDTLKPFLPAFLHNYANGNIESWNWT